MFGTVQSLLTLLVTMAPVPITKPMEPSAFIGACRDQEKALATFFSDDAVWRPERKDALLVRLQVAGLVRPKAIIPRLLAHLDYRDEAYDKHKRPPSPELRYPVYGALKKYGAAAIPDLITHLKRDDPIADDRKASIEAYLSALLLIELSDDQDIGKSMARRRIRYEIDRFPKADFPRRKALLTDPILQ